MNARNSYPEAKRLSENRCASYAEEYQVPVNVLRLTQTFGPGIARNDQRVFAEFIRSALEKKDIILLTEGRTKRSSRYTADAVTAILTLFYRTAAPDRLLMQPMRRHFAPFMKWQNWQQMSFLKMKYEYWFTVERRKR